MWEGPGHPCGLASAGSSYYKMWVGLNGFNQRLSAWWRKDRYGLHESSYCYFKVCLGTRTLKSMTSVMLQIMW